MPDAAPVLAAERFGYRYPEGAAPALDDVTLALAPGSFTVVAGLSGSGKSTLLRSACGLVPHFHGGEAWGDLRVAGMAVRDHGPNELARCCGTVLQDPEAQVVMSGVRAEIALPLEHRGEAPAAIARAVEETALGLGIADLLDRRADTLSGGELQRVALAAALVTRPALLVLDEPTSQLDPVAGDELIWALRRLNEEWGTAVLLAEHRLERCLGAADRVLALDAGRIACDAPPAEFLAWAAHAAPALATPVGRMFSLAGIGPLPASVKEARERLAAAGLAPDDEPVAQPARPVPAPRRSARARLRGRRGADARPTALAARNLWCELPDGPAILRGIDLALAPGQVAVLLGRNGAGKSTLLRHLKGLVAPTRGRVEQSGEVALLLQSPGDYLLAERIEDEAGPAAVARAGLEARTGAHPRDLSGGERQRLALEVALGDPAPGALAAALLDEPTRGMDRARKAALAERLRVLARGGAAVLVATHDTEWAAGLAERALLMGRGELIADGPVADVLAGGRHFTTEVARTLGGAGGALTPEQGAALLARQLAPARKPAEAVG